MVEAVLTLGNPMFMRDPEVGAECYVVKVECRVDKAESYVD